MNNHKQWENEMSAEFSGMMDSIRTKPLNEDSLKRSLDAAEAIVMTKASLKRGRKNAILAMLLLYPTAALIALGIDRIFDIGFTLAVILVFFGVCVIASVVSAGAMVFGRLSAGNVLLDCGPFPAPRRNFQIAVIFVASLACAISIFFMASDVWFGIMILIFLLAAALHSLIASMGRLQVCQNGLYLYWGLMRWDKIQSYRWEGDTDATLMLQAKSKLPFLGRGAVPIAIEQKAAVETLLQTHLGKRK